MKKPLYVDRNKKPMVSLLPLSVVSGAILMACAPKQDTTTETAPNQPILGQMAVSSDQLSSDPLAPGLRISYLSGELEQPQFSLSVSETHPHSYQVKMTQSSTNQGEITTKLLPGGRLSRVCLPGQNYVLTIWTDKQKISPEEEKPIKKEVTCPYKIDLSDKEQYALFKRLLIDDKLTTLRIHQLIPETQESTRFAVNGNKLITINFLNAARSKQHPATIGFYTLSTPQSLFGRGSIEVAIRKQMDKWDGYPLNRDQLIAEISGRFLTQSLFTQESVLAKLLPRVVVFAHNVDGRVQWETITTANQSVIHGKDMAPQFYSQYIAKPAEKGARGNNCSEQVTLTPDVCLLGHCVMKRTCSVNRGPGNGEKGKPGIFPGLAGLDSLPPAPGPVLSVISTSPGDSGSELIALAKSDDNLEAPAGKGSPGQSGGEGGDGGTCGCGNHKFGNTGPKGEDAPAGKDGVQLPHTPVCSTVTKIDGFINATNLQSIYCN